ncbi:hypothetical protein ABI214_00335 [Prescottella soli]|uniref:Uncharacterized protein n=1 Tax=Prescottella soli TaxID=1543852 RepID=A0ABW9G1D9_9NOCA
MVESEESGRDLTSLAVPCVGRLVATGEQTVPYHLPDAGGAVVEPVAVFLQELPASGRSASTLRSCDMDLLRW